MRVNLRKNQWFSSPRYLVMISVFAAAVSVVAFLLVLFSSPSAIEDMNGPNNINLAVIDMNEILSDVDEYSSILSWSTQKGLKTNIDGRLSEYNYEECTFSCKKLSGVKTLQATRMMHDTLTLAVSSQLDAGNLEIVIIVDGEYHSHVPVNQNASVVLTDISGKTVVVKLAAESAELNVSVKRYMRG